MPLPPSLSWNPARTWVFAVGVIRYPEGQEWPEEGRRDRELIAALQERGVPRSQIAFYPDAAATRRELSAAFRQWLEAAPPDATLWFYFAGHGARDENSGLASLCLYDGRWTLPAFYAALERHFRGEQALIFADCCYSGALGMEALLRTGRVACGVLTSSQSSTVSTGDWTFTECLIAALRHRLPVRGGADLDVSLLDLARYSEREMAMNHGQLSTLVCTNGFDPGLVLGSGERVASERTGDYVQARSSDGKFYPGRIQQVGAGRCQIRWVGYGADEDEWVADSDLRPHVPSQYPVGTRVQVKWKERWFPAVVLTAKLGVHFVHYDGFEDAWDEWVEAKRIKAA